MLGFPRNERGPAFGEIQDPLLGIIPCLITIGLFKDAECRSLSVPETLHRGWVLVPVPAPGRALDAGRRQDPRVGQQPLEPFFVGTITVAFGVQCHIGLPSVGRYLLRGRSLDRRRLCQVRHGQFGLVAGVVAIIVAACTPSSPTGVKPSPTPTLSPPAPFAPPVPSPAEASPSPSAAPSPTVYPRLPVPAGTARCHTSQLGVAFITGGAAAGNLEATFEMRNTSTTGCWVYGYVGFQALDRIGLRLPQS